MSQNHFNVSSLAQLNVAHVHGAGARGAAGQRVRLVVLGQRCQIRVDDIVFSI